MIQKVLVVDDEAIILNLLEIILKQQNYEITRASSGEQAIEALTAEDFDLVITDLHMGNINGLAVISLAKQNRQDTIAIMITGCCNDKYQTAAYLHGADDYLLKPFSIKELFERIHFHELQRFYQTASVVERDPGQLEVSA